MSGDRRLPVLPAFGHLGMGSIPGARAKLPASFNGAQTWLNEKTGGNRHVWRWQTDAGRGYRVRCASHCFVWPAEAVELPGRDQFASGRLGGWVRNLAEARIVNTGSREVPAVALSGPSREVDPCIPIEALVQIPTAGIERRRWCRTPRRRRSQSAFRERPLRQRCNAGLRTATSRRSCRRDDRFGRGRGRRHGCPRQSGDGRFDRGCPQDSRQPT